MPDLLAAAQALLWAAVLRLLTSLLPQPAQPPKEAPMPDYAAALRARWQGSSPRPWCRGWDCPIAEGTLRVPMLPEQITELARRIETEHAPAAPDAEIAVFAGAAVPARLDWRFIVGVPSLVG